MCLFLHIIMIPIVEPFNIRLSQSLVTLGPVDHSLSFITLNLILQFGIECQIFILVCIQSSLQFDLPILCRFNVFFHFLPSFSLFDGLFEQFIVISVSLLSNCLVIELIGSFPLSISEVFVSFNNIDIRHFFYVWFNVYFIVFIL